MIYDPIMIFIFYFFAICQLFLCQLFLCTENSFTKMLDFKSAQIGQIVWLDQPFLTNVGHRSSISEEASN